MPRVSARVIVPKHRLTSKKAQDALNEALDQAAKDVIADFEKAQRTWSDESKAEFKIEKGPAERSVVTRDTPFVFVDLGTKPHDIAPKNKRALWFQSGKYKPKTKPDVVGSGEGGPSGDHIARRKVIKHPGTKPRNFSKVIARKWKRELGKRINRALREAMKR